MQNRTTRYAVAAAAALMALGAAGTASAVVIDNGSITADRTASVPVTLQRDTSTRYQPLDGPVTIGGTLDLSGISGGGALLVGLVDADFYDANSDNIKTYQSGAYGYFSPAGGTQSFGPSDGNSGGEVVQNYGDLGGDTDIGDFSVTISPDGTISVTYMGQTVTDTYGDVKARPDINDGSTTPYAADEFANGAYLALDFASDGNGTGPQTVSYDLNVTGNGTTDVPEPSELGLLGLGALMIAGGLFFRRRKSPFIG